MARDPLPVSRQMPCPACKPHERHLLPCDRCDCTSTPHPHPFTEDDLDGPNA